jgi:hypothetical protein
MRDIVMGSRHLSSSEAAIVGRLIQPDRDDFSPDVARELLGLQFGPEDQARMRELSLKAQEGTLTNSEQIEVEIIGGSDTGRASSGPGRGFP